VQRVPQSQNRIVQQDFILVHATDNVDHDIGLELVEDDPVVVEDDVARLLGSLVNQTLLKGLLRLDIGVRAARRVSG
jgi:hypothetical protein